LPPTRRWRSDEHDVAHAGRLALSALYLFGGPVVQSFTAAMIWAVFVATASSIFIGGPILVYFKHPPAGSRCSARGRREKTTDSNGRRRLIGGAMAIVIRAAALSCRAPIEAYGNSGFRFGRHVSPRLVAVPAKRHLRMGGAGA